MKFNWLDLIRNCFRPGRRKVGRRVRYSGEHLEARQLLTMLAPVSVAAGTTPTEVEIRDFNGDGINDIAELNSSASTLSILLGNGDGTFQSPIDTSSGGRGSTMAVTDFNHDGYLDVAVNHATKIDVFHGRGDGSFDLPSVYFVGATANDIEVGDFNGDGYDDIVTASFSYGGTTEYYQNDGFGHFPTHHNSSIGPTGLHVEIGDVDGDGYEDLVQSSGSGVVAVLSGQGDGTFLSKQWVDFGVSQWDIEVEDLNHDGLADLVSTDGNVVSIYMGNAAGVYEVVAHQYQATGATKLKLGDVNNDGHTDIATNAGLVILGRGDGSFYAPTAYGTATGTEITLGDINGDDVLDAVSSAPSGAGSGLAISYNANNDRELNSTATHLLVSTVGTATAGTPFAVTVTALDEAGNIVTDFQGTVGISGAAGTNPVSYTFSLADGGVATVANAATMFQAGTGEVLVTAPFLLDSSGSISVVAAAPSQFHIEGQANSIAGEDASIVVSVVDAWGNGASGYTGTVHFTSSDAQAGLPADYTFAAEDNGVHTFQVNLKTAGLQTVTAVDTTNLSFTGTTAGTLVDPATASALSLSGGGGFIGSSHIVTVTSRDAFGNAATTFSGTIHLSSSDPNTITSADTEMVNGVGSLSVQPMTLGDQTLTATLVNDPSISGTEVINVTPGWGATFTMTPLSTSVVAGQTQTTDVTIYDAFGNVSTVFTGYVQISTTDPRNPVSYVYFSAADAGQKTVPVTLYTAGTQAVTISDKLNPGAAVSQAGIDVSPGNAAYLTTAPLTSAVAGTTQNMTVTLRDIYGNVATNYRGTLHISSDDASAILPADYTYTAADAGVHTFEVTLISASSTTVDISDATTGVLMYRQTDIRISPAAMTGFVVKATSVSNMTAGDTFTATVKAEDAYGNTITNYRGTVLLTSTDSQADMPSEYTFTALDAGEHTFDITLKTVGTHSVTIGDGTFTSELTGMTIKVAAFSRFSMVTSSDANSGVSQDLIVTATDAYGNSIEDYSGTVHFSSSDASAVLPEDFTFDKKEAGRHVFSVTLNTLGTQSISVTDVDMPTISATASGISVTALATNVASFSISGGSATAGTTQNVTVAARDSNGDIITGYTGTVFFSSSDQQAGLPASYTFTAADAGTHVFSVVLKTAGNQSLTVTDSAAGVSSVANVSVVPGAATRFVLSAPTKVNSGRGFRVTLTVYDAYGNVATNYTGKVELTSSDPKGGKTSYSFSTKDAGVHEFRYTLSTLGQQTLFVKDLSNSSLIGSTTVNVIPK
ncbi:MAG: VCBS repeat-containing protein [Planctomycetaceae bacterium]|nr:VCBS repeat-containing protein [Planctomycetaceae bacterium]